MPAVNTRNLADYPLVKVVDHINLENVSLEGWELLETLSEEQLYQSPVHYSAQGQLQPPLPPVPYQVIKFLVGMNARSALLVAKETEDALRKELGQAGAELWTVRKELETEKARADTAELRSSRNDEQIKCHTEILSTEREKVRKLEAEKRELKKVLAKIGKELGEGFLRGILGDDLASLEGVTKP